ncbi:MAG: hypothetical protein FWC89_08775 [Defluviitaleaceae bacterium]|nr:hypothetical protein [Defluviitaleaceae bacterium]
MNAYEKIEKLKDSEFKMFKESLVGVLPVYIIALLDSGYQGVNTYLLNALIPYKASKKHPLTDEQKDFNTNLSKIRVSIEHINRELKIFRICKETYRCKGKRGLLRVKLIASLYNFRCVR